MCYCSFSLYLYIYIIFFISSIYPQASIYIKYKLSPFYRIITFLSGIFVAFFIPETKGKNLDLINNSNTKVENNDNLKLNKLTV